MCPCGLYPCRILVCLRQGDASTIQFTDLVCQIEDRLTHFGHIGIQSVNLLLEWRITVFWLCTGAGQINQLRALLLSEGALEPDSVNLFEDVRQLIASGRDYIFNDIVHYVPPIIAALIAANLLSI